jgi:hypothetical protein
MTKPPKKRRFLRLAGRIFLAGFALAVLAAAWFLGPALYHRWWLFPREQAAIEALARLRQPVPPPEGWRELVGVCHNHSFLSHDSNGRFEEILAAAKLARLDFVLMSDHPAQGRADYSRQWTGVHDGVRFVRGFEMKYGFMPWGLPADTVLKADDEPLALARQIAARGGLLFFAHSEEERLWDLPELTGMEIYNIHTDFKDVKISRVLPEIFLNAREYPEPVLRLIFQRPTALLQRWDEMSRSRRIVGIAANDAHQNSGLMGLCTASNTFRLTTTGPKGEFGEWHLNVFTRPLLRLLCGPLRTNAPLFRFDADRYENLFRFVNTHIWVRDGSEAALLDSLRQGRVLVAFNHLADARGFQFGAAWPTNGATAHAFIGDALRWQPGMTMEVKSPLPCRFTLVRDGSALERQEGRNGRFVADRPGKYRVEAELQFRGGWVPWVYANPITLTAGG